MVQEFDRVIKFEKVLNARELGGLETLDGKQIKHGALLRSASLIKATESDVKKLQSYNLKLICDLRTEAERSQGLDANIPGAQNIWFNVLGVLPQKATEVTNGSCNLSQLGTLLNPREFNEEKAAIFADIVQQGIFDDMMENIYVNVVKSETAQKEYARMFDSILETKGGTILWHCSQGKDRAGFATVYILSVLGVDRATIMEDFVKSNESYKGMLDIVMRVADKKGVSEKHKGVVMAMIGVNSEYLKKALDYIDKEYCSIEKYMKQKLCMTDEKIAKLREYYLV